MASRMNLSSGEESVRELSPVDDPADKVLDDPSEFRAFVA